MLKGQESPGKDAKAKQDLQIWGIYHGGVLALEKYLA